MIYVTLPPPGPADDCGCGRHAPLYVVWTGDENAHVHLCAACLAAAAARAVGGELPELASVVRVLTDRNYGLADDEREDLADVALAGVARVQQQLVDLTRERDAAKAEANTSELRADKLAQELDLMELRTVACTFEREEARKWAGLLLARLTAELDTLADRPPLPDDLPAWLA